MGIVVRVGESADQPLVAFVETVLPPGIDGIRAGSIEYVSTSEAVDDLPSWADAARVRDVAFVPRARRVAR